MAALSVSQLNRYVASVLDSDPRLADLQVAGEISSLKRYPSGHIYFTLKDAECSVSCVMFRTYADGLRFMPENGTKVTVEARAALYDRDGRFQLYVRAMKPEGTGDLYAAFEALKRNLEAEGLFDERHKKPLPFLPRRIGVATSSSGAVIRDILNVLGRRFPGFDLLLIPVKVQGEGAAASIVRAIETFNRRDDIDVIIVGRGGGSMEDLWCFNEEAVARAVYASRIPIVSAVGHETDFTICDFAADLRAPTPSAAAELVLPLRQELEDRLRSTEELLRRSLGRRIDIARMRLHHSADSAMLTDPRRIHAGAGQKLDGMTFRLQAAMSLRMKERESGAAALMNRLDSLSPLKVLGRGYGIIENTDRAKIVVSCGDASEGEHLKITVSDGFLRCGVLSVEERGS